MNQTKAIFSNMQSAFNDVQADQGLGSLGEWPVAGVHNCYVLSVTVNEGEFKQAGDGKTFPAVVTQFTYQLVEDPDHAEPLEFKGAPMTIPQDPTQITHEGSQIRARIEIQRLKGHLKTLLGREPGDIGADLGEIETMLSGEQSVVCTVQCKYNTRGERTFKSEYLQSLLSG
jgi:hypothetical protein